MPRPARLLRRLLLFALLAVVGAAALAAPASAHADLLATDPADGQVVETAPTELTLQYTESVSVRPDGVRVLDADGARVDRGEATASGAVVTVPVEDLAEGTYVVAWRVVSADSHPVRGAYAFSVGREGTTDLSLADSAFGSGSDIAYEVLAVVLRGVAMVAILGVSGFVLVGAALRRPGDPPPVGRSVAIASVVGLVAVICSIVPQAALATGRGTLAITEPGVLGLALGDGFGWAILVSAVGLLAVIVTAGLPFEGAPRRLALGGAALAPVGFVVSGHTLTMSPAAVGFAADGAHVWAAAVWFGGLVAAVVAVRRCRRDDEPFAAAEAVATFSGWAAVSVAALAVAGAVLAWIEVGSIDALTTTTYGRLLLVKLAVAAVVVALAAWNRFRLVPRVAAGAMANPRRDDAAAWRSLLRSMTSEVVLLVVVLGVTAVLVNVIPAHEAVQGGPVTRTAELGEGSVDVTVDPARSGRNDIHVYVLDASGRPAKGYDEASVSLELPAQDIGPIDADAVKVAPGHFQVVGVDLALSGTWSVEVRVKPDRFTEQTAVVEVPIR